MKYGYDIIVIGAGHAGCEAALAAARMGCRVCLVTMSKETIGLMSCNPAVGGLAKGQLVRELDALGGEMAKATDACAIQYRLLNASKGPAVRSSRCQVDMEKYRLYMRDVVSRQEGIEILEGEVIDLIVREAAGRKKIVGVAVGAGSKPALSCKAAVITPGTFLNGLIHIGLRHFPAGRIDEPPSIGLSNSLRRLGFIMQHFKTGTCARLDSRTIDFSKLAVQKGDDRPMPFSFKTKKIIHKQVPCHITYTSEITHKIIRDNLNRSPLYTGIIKAQGVRYCPSIEDKVVKFSDKARHQIFLEPEGLDTVRVYPNGLSTSLPEDAQIKMIHSIEGLEKAEVIRFGYGIEHDVIEPTQLFPTLETKLVENLYLAGQINGTTGYEEAAAQGFMAGVNAALKIQKSPPLVLARHQAYIGVLIDDLVTKGTNEPYRMFTSRAEYRLVLREDNVDLRLTEIGYKIGLIDKKRRDDVLSKKNAIEKEIKRLRATRGVIDGRSVTLDGLLKRPEMTYKNIIRFECYKIPSPPKGERLVLSEAKEVRVRGREDKCTPPHLNLLPPSGGEGKFINADIAFQVEVNIKYEGYIKRQEQEIKKLKQIDKIKIKDSFDYDSAPGFSKEVCEKLKAVRPRTLGQAARISGVTPAAISLLMVWMKRNQKSKCKNQN